MINLQGLNTVGEIYEIQSRREGTNDDWFVEAHCKDYEAAELLVNIEIKKRGDILSVGWTAVGDGDGVQYWGVSVSPTQWRIVKRPLYGIS